MTAIPLTCTGETDPVIGARIEEHLPLVRHIVFQVAVHFPRHVEREELARAGALGLVEAAHRYDEGRGVPFNRFAAQRIRGAILDAVRAADWAPRSVRTVARTIEHAGNRLTSDLGRAPTHEELADEVHVAPTELTRLQTKINRSMVLALDHPVGDVADEVVTLGDTLCLDEPEISDALERLELHAYLRDAMHLLPERHRLVVVGYFLEGRTSLALAQLLGVTESRISQVRSEALAMLREGIVAQYDPAHDEGSAGRAGRRRAAFASALGETSSWRERLESLPAD
jgi:RNA polymerase sigma factor for flagellar operon FliA